MTKMANFPLRGEIWYVDLDPTIGREQAKKRPCLIISNNKFNGGSAELVIIIPITSKCKYNPLHVALSAQDSGLKIDSYILCDQIRTISVELINGTSLGSASSPVMKKVEYTLKILFDMY